MARVLMTADTVGGVWTYALELAQGLHGERIQTILATMGEPVSDFQRAQAEQIPGLVLRESTYKLEWMEQPWEDVDRAGEWLLQLEREFSPDVVHLNGFAHGSLPWRAPAVVVAHSCVLSWWNAVRNEDAPPAWDQYAARVGRGLRCASHVIAPTQHMMAAVQHHYGPLLKASVIPNGRALCCRSSGPKEPLIFAAGRLWDEAKNVMLLDRIAAELPWPVYVAGGGYGAEHARTLGRLSSDEIASWMRRASIYAFPAKYEPFGLSVLEAARAGCALVLGDIPSLRENWEGAAEFVDPTDDAAWKAALIRLTQPAEQARRESLGAAAESRALLFQPKRTAQAYAALYETCLGATGARSHAQLI
jgi:glycogen synthase